MALKQLKCGKWAHHSIEPNQAHIHVDRMGHATLFAVYRPDSIYAKKVHTARTYEAAEQYCVDNGWEPIRG